MTGDVPFAVGVHVPGVASQRWQLPLQGMLQQYPSTQLPLAHCRARVHACPLPSPGTQDEPEQKSAGAQLESSEPQLVWQALPMHA